jgi:hypothetical protein
LNKINGDQYRLQKNFFIGVSGSEKKKLAVLADVVGHGVRV